MPYEITSIVGDRICMMRNPEGPLLPWMKKKQGFVCIIFPKKVTEMKTLELVQTAVIIVLASILGVHLATDVSQPTQSSLPPVLAQEKEKSDIIETDDHQTTNYPSENVVTNTQSVPLTAIFKQVETSVVQITSKVSTVNPHIIINGNPLKANLLDWDLDLYMMAWATLLQIIM